MLGAAHYPEHVGRDFLQRDAGRMAEAGFNTVRMAEFAWHILEPREGDFDFELFDAAIDAFAAHSIRTILCTPTATPPRWLTYRYPEVVRVDVNGRPASHGSRQHADTTSPVYRAHSRRITRAMADHYSGNPNVIGWQTDNELNHSASTSYSESAARGFRKYLENRYGDIEALNHAWGGNVWAGAYQSFDQVVLPFDMAPVSNSPCHVLDYHRFLAWTTAQFQRDQVEILRAANPNWFVFHNVGRMNDLDFRGDFGRDLDFLGYDVYPLLQDERLRSGSAGHAQALHLDIARGHAGNFLVPEQMSGPGAQPPFGTLTPEPGEMRRMAFSSIARGADGILFFRWRPAHAGAEIYWGGLIDHDDVPRRRYREAAIFAAEAATLQNELLGSHVHMEVGIAGADFDNQEAHASCGMGLPSPQDAALVFHRHCYGKGLPVGFIHPDDDLSPLKVLFVPHWVIWKPEWTASVRHWVEAGGTLILGARTGSRDANNHVIRAAAPGKDLAALAGVTVEEFGRLTPEDADGLAVAPDGERYMTGGHGSPAVSFARRYRFTFAGCDFRAAHLYESLRCFDGAEPIGLWSSGFLTGQTAITRRRVGAGSVFYVGTYLTDHLMRAVDSAILSEAGVAPLVSELSDSVEVCLRVGPSGRVLFVLNTSSDARDIGNIPGGRWLVSDATWSNGLTLPGHGCHIVALD
ncbi:MAG: beta-galactosidase [Candidatus Wenzhouxiangella sp. M2_3B_020]